MTRGLVAILVPTVLVITGCTSTGSPNSTGAGSTPGKSHTPPLATFRSPPLSFRYPSGWTPAHFDVMSSFSSSIVYLGNQPMKNPCVRRNSSISCGRWAVDALEPGGVILEWTSNGFPAWSFARQPGRLLMVDGRDAKISTRRDVCDGIGADRSISVIVSRRAADNWYELDGCFRDPGAALAVADVLTTLRSVQISDP